MCTNFLKRILNIENRFYSKSSENSPNLSDVLPRYRRQHKMDNNERLSINSERNAESNFIDFV